MAETIKKPTIASRIIKFIPQDFGTSRLSEMSHQAGLCACCSAGLWRTAPPAAPPPAALLGRGSGSLCTPLPQLQSLWVDIEQAPDELKHSGTK